MTGYSTDKTPSSKPPIERVGPYRQGTQPAAAEFNRGAQTIEQIRQATEARRAHNESLSSRPLGPRSRGNRDSRT